MEKSGVSMKWRFPAEVCPATPVRKPCSPSSAWMSAADSAIRAGGTQTSSMISAVPSGRSRPISPWSPSRTLQLSSTASASRVNSGPRIVVRLASTPAPSRSSASRSAASSERNSSSRAAEVGGSSFQYSGVPGIEFAATISAGATISSTALAPAATRSGTGSHAVSMLSKWIQLVVVWGRSGTVSITASAVKASVPSEPTSSRRKISSGVSASRNAQRRYPVVFLISNLRAIRALSSASARISSRISARPAARAGSAAAKLASAPGAPVSMAVPEGSTKVSSRTVE